MDSESTYNTANSTNVEIVSILGGTEITAPPTIAATDAEHGDQASCWTRSVIGGTSNEMTAPPTVAVTDAEHAEANEPDEAGANCDIGANGEADPKVETEGEDEV